MDTEKRWIVGVDLGGTNIVVGLLPMEGGEVHALRSLPTEPHRGPKFVVDRIVEMVESSIARRAARRRAARARRWRGWASARRARSTARRGW